MKKKICIGLIIVLSLVIFSCFIIYFKYKNIEAESISVIDNTLDEEVESDVYEEILDEIINEEVIEENFEDSNNEEIIEQPETYTNETIQDNMAVESSTSKNETKTNIAQTSTQTLATETIEAEASIQETNIVENEAIIIQEGTQETISTEEVQETVSEEYKYNDTITQQIISIINSNQNEYMINYGYTVTVDSNIINLTNQFTFSESRVISKIQNKFGEIKVYSQDYYLNDTYIATECYIY